MVFVDDFGGGHGPEVGRRHYEVKFGIFEFIAGLLNLLDAS